MKLIIAATLVLLSSLTYAGEWIADPVSSCQVWNAYPSPGETISWSGACSNGKATGKGTLQWYLNGKPNGRYEGEYRDGKLNGRGVYTWPHGTRYEGEFRDGKRNGRGVYTWPDGSGYTGGWYNDYFSGFGTLTLVRGNSSIESYWEREGKGKWIGNNYVVQGMFEEDRLVRNCPSERECQRQLAAEEKAAREYANRPYREGDYVCVKLWNNTGFCGNVDRVAGNRLKVEISTVDCGGLIGVCNADSSCSGGRDIGSSRGFGNATVGDTVWIEKYCVTSR